MDLPEDIALSVYWILERLNEAVISNCADCLCTGSPVSDVGFVIIRRSLALLSACGLARFWRVLAPRAIIAARLYVCAENLGGPASILRPKNLLRNASIPVLDQLVFLKGAIKGHFYSPVPSLRDLRARRSSIFGCIPREIHAGLDLREDEQLQLATELVDRFYSEQPFSDEFLSAGQFTWCDAITLYSMIRHAAPNRVVEIGSGRSSLVTLETNKRFFQESIECTLIEPYPSTEVRRAVDQYRNVRLIERQVQDVPLETFTQLETADILFIDSSHVSKVGSDVNHIFFEILPRLTAGVRVHFHDIFYPFEYPENWIFREGRAWNEAYLLRAFLQFNPSYFIVLWMNYLIQFHRKFFQDCAPLLLNDPGGSIWIQKIG
jgi:hypothetical protein